MAHFLDLAGSTQEAWIRKEMSGYDASHDYAHVFRVKTNAELIAKRCPPPNHRFWRRGRSKRGKGRVREGDGWGEGEGEARME